MLACRAWSSERVSVERKPANPCMGAIIRRIVNEAEQSAAGAEKWKPKAVAGIPARHRRVRVVRDYGMFERREATQYYPPIDRNSASAQSGESRERRAG